jgi:hypothetical protein
MSDSEIIKTDTTNIIKTDELRIMEDNQQALFKEQAEWYRLNRGTCLCDCVNCINARKLKALI